MARILKYTLDAAATGQQRIKMPAFSRPLSVGFQRERYAAGLMVKTTLVVWAEVHTDLEVEETFHVVRTGEDFDASPRHRFIGTAQVTNNDGEIYVAHVYWIEPTRGGAL